MVKKCGGAAEIVADPRGLEPGKKILVAGVGSFDAGMRALQSGGWIPVLEAVARAGKTPILGVCLGMQLMCRRSDEGLLPGLGWIAADVKRFDLPPESGLKVPHMGWNTVTIRKPNPLIDSEAGEQRFYFVHSYHVVCDDPSDVLATAHHGYEVTASFSRGNLYGVQFHPEKSHIFGMELLKKFVELPC
jgi:glutamine amidotransferase